MTRLAAIRTATALAEILVAVVAATGLVAALNAVAPVAGLGPVYLLAVVLIAVRRGLVAALSAAVLSVLALNYFFIAPVHRLTISDSENVVALGVFLIVAGVVARLASAARSRAAEADLRAREAAARGSETEMLAGVASMLLGGGQLTDHVDEIAQRVGRALGAGEAARLELAAAPPSAAGGTVVAVPLRARPVWLHLPAGCAASKSDVERVTRALGGIMEVALERERLSANAAEAEAARRADVAKTAVLHAISHDLRSPLTAITTAAEGLRNGGDGEDAELAGVLVEESHRLARLVDDLLDLSRVEAGAIHPRLDWCDLHDVVGRAAEEVHGRGRSTVSLELPADLPLVRADSVQLERVFTNLLDNALRFSPADRPVRVTGGAGAGKVTVRVIDEGPGVPGPQRAHVFEPFVRARTGQGGAGLGLAICRGFVEANGGRIMLQSSTGRETAFAVSLPLVRQPSQVP